MPLGVKLRLEQDHIVAEYKQPDDEYEAIFKWNQARRAQIGDTRLKKPETFRLAARIPEGLLQKWLSERGLTMRDFSLDPKIFLRFVSDPEYQKCKCVDGSLI